MRALLSRCRIGCQIALLGLVGILGMFLVAGINHVANTQTDLSQAAVTFARDAKDLESHLQNLLLQARRHEKDFLLRRDENSLKLHAASMEAIGKALAGMEAHLKGEPAILATIEKVKADIGRYAAAFDAMVQQARIIGLNETQGLLGELRGSVHDVEATLKSVDVPREQIAMLMMRRHEKDFIARLDPKYGNELKARLPEFAAALDAASLPADVRSSLMAKVTAYQDTFARFVAGTLAGQAISKTLSAVYAEIEPSLVEFDNAFIARAKEAEARGDDP
jgi:methyl-accepting chemotaxis protein